MCSDGCGHLRSQFRCIRISARALFFFFYRKPPRLHKPLTHLPPSLLRSRVVCLMSSDPSFGDGAAEFIRVVLLSQLTEFQNKRRKVDGGGRHDGRPLDPLIEAATTADNEMKHRLASRPPPSAVVPYMLKPYEPLWASRIRELALVLCVPVPIADLWRVIFDYDFEAPPTFNPDHIPASLCGHVPTLSDDGSALQCLTGCRVDESLGLSIRQMLPADYIDAADRHSVEHAVSRPNACHGAEYVDGAIAIGCLRESYVSTLGNCWKDTQLPEEWTLRVTNVDVPLPMSKYPGTTALVVGDDIYRVDVGCDHSKECRYPTVCVHLGTFSVCFHFARFRPDVKCKWTMTMSGGIGADLKHTLFIGEMTRIKIFASFPCCWSFDSTPSAQTVRTRTTAAAAAANTTTNQ